MDKEMWNIHTIENYTAFKNKEILSHVTTYMNFEDIILSEINQSQNNKTLYGATE
jgi:hypothetical protein